MSLFRLALFALLLLFSKLLHAEKQIPFAEKRELSQLIESVCVLTTLRLPLKLTSGGYRADYLRFDPGPKFGGPPLPKPLPGLLGKGLPVFPGPGRPGFPPGF